MKKTLCGFASLRGKYYEKKLKDAWGNKIGNIPSFVWNISKLSVDLSVSVKTSVNILYGNN
jgi:hypothetical protein